MKAEYAETITGLLDGLKPDPRLTVSEWAAKNRYLGSSESPRQGRWNNNLLPFLVEIMDCMSVRSPIQKVVFKKSAQVGATEGANNVVGYVADVAPNRIMMVQSSISTAKKMSKLRIKPLIDSTPALKIKFKPSRSRDSGNTTLLKEFSGGAFMLAGANSAAELRMISVRYLILDEVDSYPDDLEDEGSPIDLAIMRTENYGKRKKVFILSTPKKDGNSHIQSEFLATDQRYYFVPCPHCGHMQKLEMKRLKWDLANSLPVNLRYECAACPVPILPHQKQKMLEGGEWRVTEPKNVDPTVRGYHINALYSAEIFQSWQQIATKFVKAQNNVVKLKTFTNTALGEVWVDKGEAPDWEKVYGLRETYRIGTISNDVYFITAGVDVQADRLEVAVVGWGKNFESWDITYEVIMGNTALKDVWEKLGTLANRQWKRPDGIVLPILRMCVDSGYNTHTVYNFARQWDPERIIPVKGQDAQVTTLTLPKVVDVNFEGKKVGEVKLWNIGVTLLKKEFFGFLSLRPKPEGGYPTGYCHFPEYSEDHFRGLVSEKLVYKSNKAGKRTYQWVKTYERNEPLDTRIYARAAAEIVGFNDADDEFFEALLNAYGGFEEENEPAPRKRNDDDDDLSIEI